ncbi:MAG TPA: HEAT repeat domain-containing protein [Gemmatimonadaceae bacterium]
MTLSSGDRQFVCITGPVRVAIGRADKQTVSVRKWVGGRWSASGSDVDLGDVSATEAGHYLLNIAHTLRGSSASDAVSAAAIADAADLSGEFLRLVQDDDASLDTRKHALFWLGQSDFRTADLVRLRESLKPFALREHYTFVLSQRHEDVAIDGLIDVAKHDPDAEIRKQAMFWLGQTREPKAIRFLQDILTR